MNIAAYAAMDADPPVGVAFFSLEMSKEQLVQRLLCSEGLVDAQRLRIAPGRPVGPPYISWLSSP